MVIIVCSCGAPPSRAAPDRDARRSRAARCARGRSAAAARRAAGKQSDGGKVAAQLTEQIELAMRQVGDAVAIEIERHAPSQ